MIQPSKPDNEAQRLLDAHPEADRDIVSLAILLHDIGWYSIDMQDIIEKGFGPNMMQSDVRFLHESEGSLSCDATHFIVQMALRIFENGTEVFARAPLSARGRPCRPPGNRSETRPWR